MVMTTTNTICSLSFTYKWHQYNQLKHTVVTMHKQIFRSTSISRLFVCYTFFPRCTFSSLFCSLLLSNLSKYSFYAPFCPICERMWIKKIKYAAQWMYYEDGRGHRTVKKYSERMRWRNGNVWRNTTLKKRQHQTYRATVLILNIVSSNIHVCVVA